MAHHPGFAPFFPLLHYYKLTKESFVFVLLSLVLYLHVVTHKWKSSYLHIKFFCFLLCCHVFLIVFYIFTKLIFICVCKSLWIALCLQVLLLYNKLTVPLPLKHFNKSVSQMVNEEGNALDTFLRFLRCTQGVFMDSNMECKQNLQAKGCFNPLEGWFWFISGDYLILNFCLCVAPFELSLPHMHSILFSAQTQL